MHDLIFKHLTALCSFGPWLSKKGFFYSCLTGLSIATLLITLKCYPQPGPQAATTSNPIWQFLYLTGFPSLAAAVWLVSTQVYLRTGSGSKIGLAYDGYKVDVSDWKRTRETLAELFKSHQLKGKVSLRFVPPSIIRTEERSALFMRRYRFSILTKLEHAPSTSNITPPPIPPIHLPQIKIQVATKPEYSNFLKTTFPAALQITRRHANNLIDVLDAHARGLRDILLLFAGTLLYYSTEYDDAAVILRHLDNSLADHVPVDHAPRLQIRILDMNCRLAGTKFYMSAVPDYDALHASRERAETALCYFDQFPDVAILVSRARFLVGEIDDAMDLTMRFKAKVETLKSQGQQVQPHVCAIAQINLAFLSFLQSDWPVFLSAFSTMLNDQTYRTLNWPDLVTFIDYVAELDMYEGVCYLQALYRKISRQKVSSPLMKASTAWIDSDSARSSLRHLLDRNYSLAQHSHRPIDKRSRKPKRRKKRK